MINDPLVISTSAANIGNHNMVAYSIRDPRLNAGERTAVFIAFGQSLAASFGGGPVYVPTHAAKIDQISIFDGGCYGYADPILGAQYSIKSGTLNTVGNGGSNWGRMADRLIDAGWCDRVIMIPIAVGGTSAAQWDPYSNELYPRLAVASRRAKALGLTVTAVLSQIGEQDNWIQTQQAPWAGSMLNIINAQAAEGFTSPWLIAKSTHYISQTVAGSVVSPMVRAAVDSIVNGKNIMAGPDIDTLGDAYRYDLAHMNSSGLDASSDLWKTAIMASLSVA